MNFKKTFNEVIMAVVPIVGVVLIIIIFFMPMHTERLIRFIFGAFCVTAGLVLFLSGVKVGLLPIGEMIGRSITLKGKIGLILLFGLIIGIVVTIAEPDVQVLSMQVDRVSDGTVDRTILVLTVALGVGIFVALALARILFHLPLIALLIGGYALVFIISIFTDPLFIAVSFDAGGVTTGPMTVPFILSLGAGIASVTSTSRPSSDSDTFGLVALASIGPIIAVLLLGVIYG